MLNIDVAESRRNFMAKLQGGDFAVERSQNSEDDYSAAKLQRDSQAVEAFLESTLAENIKQMR